jgi:hypothetical protein
MHTYITLPLVCLWVSLIHTTVATQDFFNITTASWFDQGDPPFRSTLTAVIYDPKTKTTATCAIVQNQRNQAIAGSWVSLFAVK